MLTRFFKFQEFSVLMAIFCHINDKIHICLSWFFFFSKKEVEAVVDVKMLLLTCWRLCFLGNRNTPLQQGSKEASLDEC